MTHATLKTFSLTTVALCALHGCGGGDSAGDTGNGSGNGFVVGSAQSVAAASSTAANNAVCTLIQPFYWEIGNRDGISAAQATGNGTVTATTPMKIASASKWIFGAYISQLRAGQPTEADIKALTMKTGYSSFIYENCLRLTAAGQEAETVDQCFQSGNNSDYTAATDGFFYYNGGHFQYYADTALGLASANNASLTTTVAGQLGQDFSFTYNSPQLAGGIQTTPNDYGIFLRKILKHELAIGDLLGTHAVCTNPATCPGALLTPVPQTESWHYSLGHWVEDDSVVGDGAFSSPGAFGFYPWIDHSKTWYGLLARYVPGGGAYYPSVQCGRLIRKAWLTGQAQ